jgi:hypothetical protein
MLSVLSRIIGSARQARGGPGPKGYAAPSRSGPEMPVIRHLTPPPLNEADMIIGAHTIIYSRKPDADRVIRSALAITLRYS